MSFNTFCVFVPRVGVDADNEGAIVQAQTDSKIQSVNQFLAALKEAVTTWVNTSNVGTKAWKESCQDLNVGDLALYLTDIKLISCLEMEGIKSLFISTDFIVSDQWHFDTILVKR